MYHCLKCHKASNEYSYSTLHVEDGQNRVHIKESAKVQHFLVSKVLVYRTIKHTSVLHLDKFIPFHIFIFHLFFLF